MINTWYAYECFNVACATHGNRGCVLDLRIAIEVETAPAVACPVCHEPMSFDGSWLADQNGYGSRADDKSWYREVAVRVVALANALQYENAMNLLRLTLDASSDRPPDALSEAKVQMQFAFHPLVGGYDHAKFDAAVTSIEKWLHDD